MKKNMKKLKSDVTIYVLAAEKSKDAQIDSMLERYKDLSGHIRVKYVNPKSKPYFYKDYTDNAPTSNSLIVVSDKRSKVIDYYDIYDYQSNMDYSTYSYNNELKGFDAEGQITSAIQYVTMDANQLPVVYQITGHDEATIGSAFSDVISKSNMTLSSVELLNEESVPKDAAAIIINAPQKDFNEKDAQKVIDESLIPAINHVGVLFDKQIYFLPQLISSAETMETGIGVVEPILAANRSSEPLGTIVIATVEHDIHDIGKNLVALMLRNYGYRVVDLGKDVPAEDIIQAAIREKADIIGLSALMTTTMMEMKKVVNMVREQNLPVKVMIGGAVITRSFADEIGAEGYSKDAQEAVVEVARLLGR